MREKKEEKRRPKKSPRKDGQPSLGVPGATKDWEGCFAERGKSLQDGNKKKENSDPGKTTMNREKEKEFFLWTCLSCGGPIELNRWLLPCEWTEYGAWRVGR